MSLNSIVLSSVPSILLSEVHPSKLPSCRFLCYFSLQLGKRFRSLHKGSFSCGKHKELFIFRLLIPIQTGTADSRFLSLFPDAYERLNPVNDCMVPMGECRIVGKGQECIQAEHNKCRLSGGKCYFLYRTHVHKYLMRILAATVSALEFFL